MVSSKALALPDLAARIKAEHRAAESAARSAVGHALTAGQLLIEAKALCEHGEWGDWLRSNFEFSDRTARAYMQVAKRWPELEAKRQSTADLSLNDALQLLAEPKAAEPALPDKLADLRERFDRAETVADYAAVAQDALKLQNEAAESKLRAERSIGKILNAASGCQGEVLTLVAMNPDVDFTPVINERIAELEASEAKATEPTIALPDLRAGFKFWACGQCANAGEAYVEIIPSADWPGYWYAAVHLGLDSDAAAVEYNKRATKCNAALLRSLLESYGFTPEGEWHEEPSAGEEPWYITAPGKPGRAVACHAGGKDR